MKVENAAEYAQVRADHRIACLDAITARQFSNMGFRSMTALCDWIDSVASGRTVAEVVRLASELRPPTVNGRTGL